MSDNTTSLRTSSPTPQTTNLRHQLLLYLCEATELGLFMLSACTFAVLLFHPASAAVRTLPSPVVRRALMGMSMGITAVLIIQSRMGKLSGAHFNPAITLTFLRLGKIGVSDAIFYIAAQFIGGIVGVGLSVVVFGRALASPGVDYVVTVPGVSGVPGAFTAEFFMAALLLSVVLWTSTRPRLARYTPHLIGILIALYVMLLAPVSGFSINPARTTASALFAHVWTSVWIYFTAPSLGMLLPAELYLRRFGKHPSTPCRPHSSLAADFHAHYFTHRHLTAHHRGFTKASLFSEH